MHADYDVRTPTFKQSRHITNASPMKELPCFRTNVIDAPVEVLHPVLPVGQDPIVKAN
jgi:hypothetical protein